jgi:sugar phosphate permease
MSILIFLRGNARWLAGAFLLTFFSSFGQTFFISLSAGGIRSEYGLSNGGFGTLYMVATLACALTLPWLGQIVDWMTARRVTFFIVPMLAIACLSMAFSHSIVLLVITIYMLRLFGQGMMTHNAITATARWFVNNRGRALSIAVIGHQTGEALFPITYVAVAAILGWRLSWVAAAVFLLAVALPLAGWLNGPEREPAGDERDERALKLQGWTRGQVLRDGLFYLMMGGILAPGFIGTTIFFHQVYLIELRGWSREAFAIAFMALAGMTLVSGLVAGQMIDRFSATRLLPGFLVPLGAACIVLGMVEAQWSAFAFMGLMGITYGFSSTISGAVWPEVYGMKHLGAIRSLTVALMVFSTAAGPGLTGFLIDAGIAYPFQIIAMGIYCFAAAAMLLPVSAALLRRGTEPGLSAA